MFFQRPRIFLLLFLLTGMNISCAALFGWKIHAPGVLSNNFSYQTHLVKARVALYPDPALSTYISKNKGGRTADPQTYFIGEAFQPMLIEAFQSAFEEFILMETEPDEAILKRYQIPYLVMVRMKEFGNEVAWSGRHGVRLKTEILVLDETMKKIALFEATGSSEAKGIFAKKGGPEVNLNAAIENNLIAVVQYLQDGIERGRWGQP